MRARRMKSFLFVGSTFWSDSPLDCCDDAFDFESSSSNDDLRIAALTRLFRAESCDATLFWSGTLLFETSMNWRFAMASSTLASSSF